MRIAFLTHEPFYPASGGGSIEAIYLVETMARNGMDVDVFCPDFQVPEYFKEDPWSRVRFYKFKKWEMGRYTRLRNIKYLLFPFQLVQMVRSAAWDGGRRYDWVWGQHSIACVAAGMLKKSVKVKCPSAQIAMNYLDLLTGFMENWPKYLAPPFLLKRLTQYEISTPLRYQADQILTVSDELLERFHKLGVERSRLHPFYFGIDANLFASTGWEPQLSMQESPEVVMHGSFDHHHLGPLALEATLLTLGRHPGIRFRFIGNATSAWKSFEVNLKKKGADMSRIDREDFIPYESLPSKLAQSHIGWVPYEPSSGTHSAFIAKFVEYQALGMPTVSGKLRGIFRYFGDSPIARFTEFNGQALSDALLDVVKEPVATWRERGVQIRQKTLNNLDWRVLAEGVSQRILTKLI